MRALITVIVFLATSLTAQQSLERVLGGFYASTDPSSTFWTNFVWNPVSSGGSELCIQQGNATTFYAKTALTFPATGANALNRPGDSILTPAHDEMLLVGDDKLIAIRPDANRVFSVAWSVSMAGSALVGVTFSDGMKRVYVLDGNGVVLWSSYVPGGAAPAVWTTIADQNTLPTLVTDQLADYELTLRSDSASLAEIAVHSRLHQDAMDSAVLHHPSVGPTTVSHEIGIWSEMAILEHVSLQPGQTSAGVDAPVGSTVNVVRVDVVPAQIVGTATVPSGSLGARGVVSVPTSALEWGAVYAAKISSVPRVYGPFKTPQALYSTNDTLPLECTFADTPSGGELGHPGGFMTPALRIDTSNLQTTITYPTHLNINVDNPKNPPINFSGPSPVLIPAVVLDYSVMLDAAEDSAGLLRIIDLPADPALVGVVYLFQWSVDITPLEVRVGDIVGVAVRGIEWDPKNPMPCPTAAASSSSTRSLVLKNDPASRLLALRAIAKTRTARTPTPAEVAAYLKKALAPRSR